MKRFAWVITMLFLLLACRQEPLPLPEPEPEPQPEDNTEVSAPAPGEYKLPLIETTDIHGYIVYTEGSTVHYRLAYVADKVKDTRGHGDRYDKDRLLLLDGGDLYQGASVSNLQDGKPVYVAMDVMEYDAVALGNHEFDWGIESLIDPDATLLDYEMGGSLKENKVPVVCANLYRNGSRVSWTKDYVIVEKSAFNSSGASVKVKIGIIGFAVNYQSSIMASKFSGKGFSINDDFSVANRIAASLEASGECDATVLLIHGAAQSSAERLGSGSVIDLVLGGHSHQTQSGKTGGGMPYLQGGRYCEHYACSELTFTVDSDGKVSFKSADNLRNASVDSAHDLRTYAGQNSDNLDDEVVTVSDEAVAAVSEQLNDVIGYIDVPATNTYIDGSGKRASNLSNWMCDILCRIGEADVSFVNSGGIRTSIPLNGKSRRNIAVSNVYEIFPFCNTTYVYSITYSELMKVFEYAMTSGGNSLFSCMTGVDCRFSSNNKVISLSKDGTVIYKNGSWTGDWASREVILSVSEYLATTQRTDYYTSLSNPLIEWNSTQRLLYNSLVDNENAVLVLREEASESGGRLDIDTTAHFILAD
ncbi:MAG: bifunctional metallophosphatase/5'-nucleotidase [Bacteroidales bacterium]|nr:bifunctional metallophosphatase/5'-nucleotidase [Bacteroidales bacterium]